jgi:hypothetical protein
MKRIIDTICSRNFLPAALVCLILGSAAARADTMTLTTSGTRPTGNVILETTVNTTASTGTRSNTTSNPSSRWNGVTFSLNQSFDINTVSFTASSIYKDFSGASFDLLLVDMTGVTVAYNQPVVLGSVIETYSIASANITQNYPAQVWLTFDIGTKTLAAGKYAFILTLPGDLVRALNTNPAADESISSGFMTTDEGLTYVGSGAPLAFTIQGTAAIPEPSTTVGALGLVGLALAVARRLHRIG